MRQWRQQPAKSIVLHSAAKAQAIPAGTFSKSRKYWQLYNLPL